MKILVAPNNKQFTPINIRPAANGVIVSTAYSPENVNTIRDSSEIHVFNEFKDLSDFLQNLMINNPETTE